MAVMYCWRARARKDFLEARKDKKLQVPSVMTARAGQACARVGARVAQGREGIFVSLRYSTKNLSWKPRIVKAEDLKP